MANAFIAMCYAAAKKAGVDTSKMTPEEVVEWYNKQQGKDEAKGKAKEIIKEYVKGKETNSKEALTNSNTDGKISVEKRALKDFKSLNKVLNQENLDELIQKSKFAFFSKGREDLIVKPMIEEIGFNKSPQFVDNDKFEELKNTNIFLCRGLTSPEHVKTFETGDMFIGLGVNGSGVYTTTELKKAQDYAGANGGVAEMLLDSNAKVGDGIELTKQAKELLFSLKSGQDISGNPIDLGLDAEKMIKVGEGNNKRFVTLLALAEGYDAIKVGNGDYIILNRSAVIMRRRKDNE